MSQDTSHETPRVTIVIPVYNEEAILQSAILDLIDQLRDVKWTYEIVIAENGSRDGTVAMAKGLAERFPQVRTFSFGQPNYGGALRRGILEARGTFVICEEIDLCDVNFQKQAISILETGAADLVVGSKAMKGASDERPMTRRVATKVFNGMLRISLGFRGTDTHGLKAFRREAVQPVAGRCIVDKDIFASELVIRAQREGVTIREVPVRVLEKRVPSIALFRRVPNVFKSVGRLVWAIRVIG
jgi:glycosyltransferase involved in cell wall biosynthesis